MAVAASSSSKTSEDNSFFYGFRSNVRHLSVQFWELFVLQWHGVLLSAGAFGGVRPSMAWCFAVGRCFCCWCTHICIPPIQQGPGPGLHKNAVFVFFFEANVACLAH